MVLVRLAVANEAVSFVYCYQQDQVDYENTQDLQAAILLGLELDV